MKEKKNAHSLAAAKKRTMSTSEKQWILNNISWSQGGYSSWQCNGESPIGDNNCIIGDEMTDAVFATISSSRSSVLRHQWKCNPWSSPCGKPTENCTRWSRWSAPSPGDLLIKRKVKGYLKSGVECWVECQVKDIKVLTIRMSWVVATKSGLEIRDMLDRKCLNYNRLTIIYKL